ncbi:hypothetical protein QWM81_25085 [Streptomyces ficellus]|uniref:Twin-arginine translocation signal domain-containing protein n=1 Tax=Streptomyces ficellus TaxID=1977088 RepID=A0ABT7ZCL5_9ACTN|nr:hypothetical protein [Streptomyces ficellus]MDN3297255.1 hypothetical protein [Streptomyces ficellus]
MGDLVEVIGNAAGVRHDDDVMHMSSDEQGHGRRKFLKRALAATAGGLLVPAAADTARANGPLPPIGSNVTTAIRSSHASMRMSPAPGTDPLPTLDFIGRREQRVEMGGFDFVRLRTLNFTVRASHPLFGEVSMKLPDISVAPMSTLRFSGPGSLVETWLEAPTLTFDRLGDQEGPFVFEAEQPFKFTAHLKSWPPPPEGAPYALASPMTFTRGETRVEFTAFPALISS